MKFLLSLLLGSFPTIIFSTQLAFAQNLDVELEAGQQVFLANCAACHSGGANSVVSSKTLQISDLEKYEKNTVDAIVNQVTYGNGGMPAFGERLDEDDIQNVAKYVLNQAINKLW